MIAKVQNSLLSKAVLYFVSLTEDSKRVLFIAVRGLNENSIIFNTVLISLLVCKRATIVIKELSNVAKLSQTIGREGSPVELQVFALRFDLISRVMLEILTS